MLTTSSIDIYSLTLNTRSKIISSVLSLIIIFTLLALPFALIDIYAQSIRKKKSINFRSNYSSIYRLFKYRQGFWKTLYYPLILFQRILYVFISIFLSFESQLASAIVMIVFALLILLYLKSVKPFQSNFNNYLGELSQLFLALFYGQCLLLQVYGDDEY